MHIGQTPMPHLLMMQTYLVTCPAGSLGPTSLV